MRFQVFPFDWRHIGFSVLAAITLFLFSTATHAHENKLHISVPGPGNLLYLPAELAKKIGADTDEGVDMEIRFFGGGPQAFQDMLEKNSDFSVGGMAALAEQRVSGNPVVSIAAISQVPAYSLIVRNELKSKIKKIADLKGHVIGVKGHTKGGRSTTQMFIEYLIINAGIAVDSVNFVPAGQSYAEQHAALASGAVDALMGDEPFVSRLENAGIGFYLVDLHNPATVRKLLGGLFLNSQLATREDVIANQPATVEKMVRIMKRTLVWIDRHSAQDIVKALDLPTSAEREALLSTLIRYKHMYSPDGAFSNEQIRITENFFHQVSQNSPAARALPLNSFIVDKWASRKR